MPRPKGTFMKPEDFEKLTPKQQQKYRENTADYRRNFARREAAKRTIPTYTERRQREYDAQAIDYDAFPESMLREWLRTNAPTMGACRQHTARWITTNAALGNECAVQLNAHADIREVAGVRVHPAVAKCILPVMWPLLHERGQLTL